MPLNADITRFEQLKASGDLPTPRGVALAIMKMTQREDITLAELAAVIKSDPAFVGRLVKAANGMLVPGRRPVVSVQEALMVLGLPAVRSMALGFSLLNEYRRGRCRGFDYEAFWAASLLMAITMQLLAQRTRVAAPDEVFSIGLLARVGQLALATVFPDEYTAILRDAGRNHGVALLMAEEEAFAIDHCALGGAMLANWGLPTVFCRPVQAFGVLERGGFPQDSRERALTLSLQFSLRMAQRMLCESADIPTCNTLLAEAARGLSLDDTVVQALFERIAQEWKGWAALLQFRSATTTSGSLAAPLPEPLPEEGDAAAPIESEGLRVLVVDDEASVRALVCAVVREAGYEAFEARNGREGLEATIQRQPDIIVVDWLMPELDGIDLVRSLRTSRHGRGLYVLLLTGVGDEQRLVEAFDAGVDDFVCKPFSPALLAARLQAGRRVVLLQRELAREREELRHFAAELAVSNRRLSEAALTDALTGFRNRRYAMERLQQEWLTAERSGRPLSCMVVDLDGFKDINDRHGHDVGDLVLRRSAETLQGALRRQDVICRTGGDEFLVICPDTPFEAARACAERLCSAMGALHIAVENGEVTMTASIGVAAREAGMEDMDALIKRADQGAYLAKRQGRNRVGIYGGGAKEEGGRA